MTVKNGKNIQSIERAVNILNCFNSDTLLLSLQEMSDIVRLNISTTRGIVKTLVSTGLLNYDEKNKKYHLGLYFTAKAALISNREEAYITVARPYIEKISEKYSVTCSFQIVQGSQICTIYSVGAHNANYEIHVAEHTLLSLTATASGKLCMLYNIKREQLEKTIGKNLIPYTEYTIKSFKELSIELDKIEKKGYSFENQEYQMGVSSISFPILDSNNHLIATLSITSFSNHVAEIKNALIENLKSAANEIKENLHEIL